MLGKKRLTNALTGGKYDNLKGKGALAHIGAGAKNLAPKAGKWLGRAGGTALGVAAGGMVGVATAMTTGDLKNVTTGLTLGATTGWSRGGQLGQSITSGTINGVGGFVNDMQQYRIDTDQAYSDHKKFEQEKDAFAAKGIKLNDAQLEALEEVAPYMDVDGDVDKLDDVVKIRSQMPDASVGDILGVCKLGDKFDLYSSQGQQDAFNYQVGQEMKKINDNDIQVSDTDINDEVARQQKEKDSQYAKEYEKNREGQIAKAREEQKRLLKEAEEKANKAVEKEITERQANQAEDLSEQEKAQIRQETYDKVMKKEREKIAEKVNKIRNDESGAPTRGSVDRDAVKAQLIQNKKQALAESEASRKVQIASK